MKIFFIFFYLFLSSSLIFSNEIIFNDINEFKMNEKEVRYIIKAESKNIRTDKLKNFKFYNKQDVLSNSSYYENGNFKTKYIDINFKKAYFLEGNFIMTDTKGVVKNNDFSSEKVTYKFNSIDFKNVLIKIDKTTYRKLKYSINLEN
jgi:hypothetical protein